MGRGTWSWIVPDGLREIAKPLVPPSKVRSQGGGTQDTPDETLFAAIVYLLVSGCAWRALSPCFGISKSTAHRRFMIWSRAGVWGRLHEAVLDRIDECGLLDLSSSTRRTCGPNKGTNSKARVPWTGAKRVPRCTSCRTDTDCLSSSASPQPTRTTASD
ncbi:transposase [Streptomyces sp. NPDC019539]|uniref:transposase n=1 Tax=Streptomyces sp. NPDC019539 TaxID=3365063 RepID=UPI0037937F36